MKRKVHLIQNQKFKSGQKMPLGKAVQTGWAHGSISLPFSASSAQPESEVLSCSLMPLMDFFFFYEVSNSFTKCMVKL